MNEHDASGQRHDAAQPALPLEAPSAGDAADRPIPYALTARARREVAPEALPTLRVVSEGEEAGPDEADMRPARARALRRAGMPVSVIARQLDADELLVRVWTGDVRAARRRSRVDAVTGGSVGTSATSAVGTALASRDPDVDAEALRRYEQRRVQAAADARARLADDADFAAGVGLIAGLAEFDHHAVTLVVNVAPVAARAVAWLLGETGLDGDRVRVVLRLGRAVAGDRARHRWAEQLAVPLERVSFGRARDALEHESAMIRLADAEVAAAVAGWCDALIAPDRGELDLAF